MSEESILGGDCTDILAAQEPIIQLTENGVEGFEILCRLCANRSDHLISIYSEEGITNDLADKMNLYLPVKVTKSDLLPLQCCFQCASTVLTWHELVIASVEADRRLREIQAEVEKQLAEQNTETETDLSHLEPEPEKCLEPEDDRCTVPHKNIVARSLIKEESTSDHLIVKTVNETHNNGESHQNINLEVKLNKADLDQSSISSRENELSKDVPVEAVKNIVNLRYNKKRKIISMVDDQLSSNTQKYVPLTERKKIELEKQVPKCKLNARDEIESCDFNNPKNQSEPLNPNINSTGKKELNCKNLDKPRSKLEPLSENEQDIDKTEDKINSPPRRTFQCAECDRHFFQKLSLQRHIRIHRDERPFTCHVCGKGFRDTSGLNRHIRDVHKRTKNFSCDICSKSFASSATRDDHRRRHTKERPFICSVCGKTFSRKATLYTHSKTHVNVFPFSCSVCEKKFRRRQELTQHSSTHSGEKPFQCKDCGKFFRIKSSLVMHRLLHTDVKPFTCNICGISFRQARYLRNHINSKHCSSENGVNDGTKM